MKSVVQMLITPAAGKRLIAKALVEHPDVKTALDTGTIVIIAGSTNGYVAEEILTSIGQGKDFSKNRFFRGVTLPPARETTETGRLPDESGFLGDVVIENGVWQKGKTIFDVQESLAAGDLIIKGANCLSTNRKRAGILIGHPKGGTITAAIQGQIGKRVKLLLPVGLEKRVTEDLDVIANLMNQANSTGLRMLPVTGEIISELEAIKMLFGQEATLVAAGGVCGAEGSIWLAVEGDSNEVQQMKSTIKGILKEEPFRIQ